MSEHDVICTGAKECKELKGAIHIIHCGSKEIKQRPEYCSGRSPHLYRHEEDSGFTCPFINKWVEGRRIWMKVKNGTTPSNG